MIIVAGSQADRAEKNKITVLKISDVQKTQTTGINLLYFCFKFIHFFLFYI